MKNKRDKERANKKKIEQDQEKAKLLVKDRLMALELKAISAASKVSQKYCYKSEIICLA